MKENEHGKGKIVEKSLNMLSCHKIIDNLAVSPKTSKPRQKNMVAIKQNDQKESLMEWMAFLHEQKVAMAKKKM